MPVYSYHCPKCNTTTDRYVRLRDFDREAHNQRCECGTHMKKLVTVPVLQGLDSGPEGFMRGRVENDGCPDEFTRQRVRRNNGGSLSGTFVPGLCRPGVPFDPQAICHSRDEVVKKARKLGVAVRGPGINVEPREQAPIEDDGVPSERAMALTIRNEIQEKHGGRVSGKKYKEIVEALKDRHSRKRPPKTKAPDSIYQGEMASRTISEKELMG